MSDHSARVRGQAGDTAEHTAQPADRLQRPEDLLLDNHLRDLKQEVRREVEERIAR